VLRSRSVYGPYEDKIVLKQGSTGINGPHQGGWIELANGDSWFIHFQDSGVCGRITHLQPMRWQEGWPMMGIDLDGDGIGEPVRSFAAPALPIFPAIIPTSDEFGSSVLGLQWQWQANIDTAWFSLDAARGFLRLFAVAAPDSSRNLWDLPNIVAQKFPAARFEAVTRLSFQPAVPGERAGLVIFGSDYAALTVIRQETGCLLRQSVCMDAEKGGGEEIVAAAALDQASVFLKVSVSEEARCSFSYSTNGSSFKAIGVDFSSKPGRWVGAKIGLFAAAPPGEKNAGYGDFDFIHITSQ
jgi:beta-xylosidase